MSGWAACTSCPHRERATLKPEIPTSGSHGIPLRDELELEMDLYA